MFAKLGFGAIASAAAGLVMMGSAQAIVFKVTFLGDATTDLATLAASAAAVEAAFKSQGTLLAFEDFEAADSGAFTFVGGQSAMSFQTDVGVFTSLDVGNPLIINDIGTCNVPSCGRVPVSGENWLDNGDADSVLWEVDPAANNAVGFFTVDPSDQGGETTITAKNGDTVTLDFGPIVNSPNGGLYYIEVYDVTGIASIQYVVVDNVGLPDADGWGIDNVSILLVPEPTTIALFGAGLLGLGLYRRRRAA
jgi:hypothetical protein